MYIVMFKSCVQVRPGESDAKGAEKESRLRPGGSEAKGVKKEAKSKMVDHLKSLGAKEEQSGRSTKWIMSDGTEMPAKHLDRVLAKQKCISEGRVHKQLRIKEEVPQGLVEEGWEIMSERKSTSTMKWLVNLTMPAAPKLRLHVGTDKMALVSAWKVSEEKEDEKRRKQAEQAQRQEMLKAKLENSKLRLAKSEPRGEKRKLACNARALAAPVAAEDSEDSSDESGSDESECTDPPAELAAALKSMAAYRGETKIGVVEMGVLRKLYWKHENAHRGFLAALDCMATSDEPAKLTCEQKGLLRKMCADIDPVLGKDALTLQIHQQYDQELDGLINLLRIEERQPCSELRKQVKFVGDLLRLRMEPTAAVVAAVDKVAGQQRSILNGLCPKAEALNDREKCALQQQLDSLYDKEMDLVWDLLNAEELVDKQLDLDQVSFFEQRALVPLVGALLRARESAPSPKFPEMEIEGAQTAAALEQQAVVAEKVAVKSVDMPADSSMLTRTREVLAMVDFGY